MGNLCSSEKPIAWTQKKVLTPTSLPSPTPKSLEIKLVPMEIANDDDWGCSNLLEIMDSEVTYWQDQSLHDTVTLNIHPHPLTVRPELV